ncbi:hypothetical protein ACET3Z_018096 [Daucus carota]
MKRQRFQVVKNDLGVELTKLTNASGDLNIRLQTGNELFAWQLKNMREMQADIVNICRLVEYQYGEAIKVLDDKPNTGEDESAGENEVLPRGYDEDVKKFVTNCRDSLNSHGVMMESECAAMEELLKKYSHMLQASIDELRDRGELIAKLRTTLRCKLSTFGRTELEYSDSE